MHIQTPLQTSMTFETNSSNQARSIVTIDGINKSVVTTPRFTPSVVKEIGLGRFVYIKGQSGKRYIFSAIEIEQAPLYDNAIFAFSDFSGQSTRFSCSIDAQMIDQECLVDDAATTTIYVHMLAEGEETDISVLADLSAPTH